MKKTLTVFCLCESTNTIRTLPQNYLIAYNHQGRWICDPDCAVPEKMAIHALKVVHTYEGKYSSGIELLAKLTPAKFYK